MQRSFLVSAGSKPSAKTKNAQWCGCFDEQSKESEHLRKILYVRMLLIGSLLVAAATVSTLSNIVLSDSERNRFVTQYNSISDSALSSVWDSFSRSNIGLRELASTYSYNYPNASAYPEVTWLGFQRTAGLLSNISAVTNMGFVPIVKPSELASYEASIKQYYLEDPAITTPTPNMGLQLGQVWGFAGFMPYHATTGVNVHSPYTYIAPVAQFTYSDIFGAQFYNFDLHSFSFFSVVLDRVIACTESATVTDRINTCGAISESTTLPFASYFEPNPPVKDVQALLAHPIFPASNHSKIVGFTAGAVSWKSMLLQAVPTFVSGLDCVVTTGASTTFTFTITDGVPVYSGAGDRHDVRFNKYRRGRTLDTQNAQVASATSYEITFYPRSEFVQAYTTAVPIIAPIALVLVFLFCSIIFFAYDILMKREFGRKQAVLDTKRRFVRFISHEIRTPLNTVRLGLKLFDGELSNISALIRITPLEELPMLILNATEGWRHLADDISTNSTSAVEVLDDLLNYDKIEMGNLRLELTMFNVWDLTRRTTSIMQMQAQQKNIALELTCDGVTFTSFADAASPPSEKSGEVHSTCVIGDVSRMGQVLRNLISNALKFTPAGGYVSVTAMTVQNGMPDAHLPAHKTAYAALDPELEVRDGSICISVKDSGAGLTEKQLLEICNEGVQFNANELQAGQGSGLGLFISKGIVEQHGGTLSVASEGLGKGVTFTVELPLYQASDSQSLMSSVYPSRKISHKEKDKALSAQSLDAPSADSLRTISGVRRTIVVDDSHFNRKMLVRLLTSRGFVCEQAENGVEAISVYQDMCNRAEPVDAILMDFEMPVMNGPTATKKLRELGCTCLIVGVTGNVLPEDVHYFKSQGADAVLVKPLVVEAFEELLSRHLFLHHRAASDEITTADMLSSLKLKGGSTDKASGHLGQVHPL